MNSTRPLNAAFIAIAMMMALTGTVLADTAASAGSSTDTQVTSVTTHVSAGFVGTDPDVPVSLNYGISAKGITLADGTYAPMTGTATAFFTAHLQGGDAGTGTKSTDVYYSEYSSASGFINSFSKSFSYQGGVSLV
ncbi:MAG TPA: hypothetical protein VMC42_05495 [Methanoregulaceae archaeon]|nr:hypothetical protein [Methanoregulaceae archaeon]